MLETNDIIEINLSKLAVIVVTYNPKISILERQFRSIPKESTIIIVDNNSKIEIRSCFERITSHKCKMIINDENLGLAKAINQGAKWAYENQFQLLLLLDQDTEPEQGSIENLVHNYQHLNAINMKVGCIGPNLIDDKTGISYGFHRIVGFKWSRIYPFDNEKPLEISSLNGSGTLISSDLFHQLGGLDQELFIDHVDTEWSFRVIDKGYKLYGVPSVFFKHRMGDKSIRFWFFGWKVWPYRSPKRHYYLFRNAVFLLKRNYVPNIWKFWLVIKLVITILVHLCFDPLRIHQFKFMLKGLKSGIRK